jgi:hypothetical protein
MQMNDFFAQQIFGNMLQSAELWLGVAYLVCTFAVLAFRPEQIENVVLFRLSYVLFALFLVLPSLVNALNSFSMMDGMGRRGEGAFFIFQLSGVLGKILLGGAIICGLSAMKRHKAMEERWDNDRPPPIP